MIATESTLWDALAPIAEREGVLMTRMEVSTALGVGDVEYVARRQHGWLELKIAGRKHRACTQSEFTADQAKWLLAHHKPLCFLRSWLLVAHAGDNRWERFTLCEPAAALCFLRAREGSSWDDVHQKVGARVILTLEGVIRAINV